VAHIAALAHSYAAAHSRDGRHDASSPVTAAWTASARLRSLVAERARRFLHCPRTTILWKHMPAHERFAAATPGFRAAAGCASFAEKAPTIAPHIWGGRMRRACLLLAALSLLLTSAAALAQSDLRKPPGKEWLTIGGDWYNTRFSALTQINRTNVKDLKAAWVIHLGSGLGQKYSLEGTPIVKDGIMYMASGNDDVFALDARSGSLIWEHLSGIEQNISTICCGWDNRGVALGEGKVFVGQLDGTLVALDAKNGQEVWRAVIGRWQDGSTITSAPLYYNGAVYSGLAGGDRGGRGKLTALDAKTGKELWHFWTVPEPGAIGSDTWPSPNDPDPVRAGAYLHGGANVWQTPAVDPDLGLIYFSTGNPGPAAIGIGANRPGDNLFSSSIVALHLDGSYAWHFQQVHHDLWDFDCPSPVVLFDQVYEGKLRRGLAEACKTGWIYILDRTDGKPLIGIEEKPVEQEPRSFTAPTQPIPVGNAVMPQCPQPLEGWITKCIFGSPWDVPVLMSPGGNGGVNWAPMSYDPQNGYFYVAAADRPVGRVAPGSGKIAPPAIGAKYSGTLTAVDSRTNRIVWQKKTPYSIGQGSGALTTASGLLFHGEPDGNFQAYDAKSGELLWHWQTGAGADAPAITYEIDGEQYVAIAAGGVSIQTASANGDMIWVFSLKGNRRHRIAQFDPPNPPPSQVSFNFTGLLKGEVPIVKTNAVKMIDYAYAPSRITVTTGTKVTFTNTGQQPHNAAGPDLSGWDIGILTAGQTATVTFNKPGTYLYACTPHPFMIGQVIVTGPEIASAPPVVVESSGVKADGPMTMPMTMPATMPGHDAH
jgi:alcohol dehydrogenase (cytochrome c)